MELTDPWVLALLGTILFVFVQYQRTLTWTEYRTLHALKRGLFPLIDKRTGLFVVSRKGGRDDPEFITTVDMPVGEVFSKLNAGEFDAHLLNSVKKRQHPTRAGFQYSKAHLFKFHEDETQTEIYLFDVDGKTDIYAHVETWVLSPKDHLVNTNQQDGDTKNVLPEWIN